MMFRSMTLALLLTGMLTACGDEDIAELPPPQEPTQIASGYYCSMTVVEHDGPKGHIYLEWHKEPIWFTSVRDTIAFTMLPEETKDIVVVYVNDMAKATNWNSPEPGSWIKATDALYVIGSTKVGGMGAPEPVPFSDSSRANAFARSYGGQVVAFADIPRDYILSDPNENVAPEMARDDTMPDHSTHDHSAHGHNHGTTQ